MNRIDTQHAGILIVDDMPENITILRELLAERGYRTRPAISGEVALHVVRTAPPDLILLDIMMPGMDGFELCRRLKSDDRLRDIPVIFLSALHDTTEKVNAFALGGVDYITKPFQAEEVLARVLTHVSLHQARRQLQQEIALRRQAEAELTRSHALLEERVAARTACRNCIIARKTICRSCARCCCCAPLLLKMMRFPLLCRALNGKFWRWRWCIRNSIRPKTCHGFD